MISAPALERLGPCDAVFVSAHEGEAALSCAARLAAERRRGRRTLVVTLFRAPDEEPEPGGLSIGLADASHRSSAGGSLVDAVFGTRPLREDCLADACALLDLLFRRTQARQIYLPLGVGGHVDHRIAYEGGVASLPPQPGRDVFLYEERPDALVPGAVGLRLAQLGAGLPPGASRVRDEAGLLRFVLLSQTLPHRRETWRGLRTRAALTRRAARAFWQAREWRPQKALGVRLQPVVQEAADIEALQAAIRRYDERRGTSSRARSRLTALCASYGRRVGASAWAERYWLLLPSRDPRPGLRSAPPAGLSV